MQIDLLSSKKCVLPFSLKTTESIYFHIINEFIQIINYYYKSDIIRLKIPSR
jgi:hypothetical protein